MGWTDAVQNWLNYSGAKSQANRDESIVMRKGIENAITKAEAGIPLNQSEKDMINYARQSNQQYGNSLAQEAAMGATASLDARFLSKAAKFLNAKGVPRSEIKNILSSINGANSVDDIAVILGNKYGNVKNVNLNNPGLQSPQVQQSSAPKLLEQWKTKQSSAPKLLEQWKTKQSVVNNGQRIVPEAITGQVKPNRPPMNASSLNNFMTQEVPEVLSGSNKQSVIDFINKSKGYGSNIASNATNFFNNNKMAVGITGLATTTVPAMNYMLNGNSEQQQYPNYVEQNNGVTADTVNARMQNTPAVQQQAPVNQQPQVATKQTQPTTPTKQPMQTNIATVAKAASQRFVKKAWDINETKKINEITGLNMSNADRVAVGRQYFGKDYRGTEAQNTELANRLKAFAEKQGVSSNGYLEPKQTEPTPQRSQQWGGSDWVDDYLSRQ